MILIRAALSVPFAAREEVQIVAERQTLAKRRWRGLAADGIEFGFDLEKPLRAGDFVHLVGVKAYRLAQAAEPVLEIPLLSPAQAVKTGWQIGNLHFPLAVVEGHILVQDDPAIRQLFERERTLFRARTAVFKPLHAVAPHSH
jgi:urease accessory protein